MARLFLTQRAMDDLAAIDSYSIQTWGQRVADEYIAAFEQAFDLLRDSPQLLRERNDFAGPLRFHRVKSHWLVCDIIDQHIYVLTIKHGAMDMPARLAELQPQLIQEAELLHRRITGGSS